MSLCLLVFLLVFLSVCVCALVEQALRLVCVGNARPAPFSSSKSECICVSGCVFTNAFKRVTSGAKKKRTLNTKHAASAPSSTGSAALTPRASSGNGASAGVRPLNSVADLEEAEHVMWNDILRPDYDSKILHPEDESRCAPRTAHLCCAAIAAACLQVEGEKSMYRHL